MKIARVKFDEKIFFGEVLGNTVKLFKGNIFNDEFSYNQTLSLSEVKILPPFIPSKVIALGYNYKDLIGERESYDEPVIFLKPPSAVIGINDDIIIVEDRKVWIEVELAIVLKRVCKNIQPENASDYILGYTIANDVTIQNISGRDHHLARSKAWDTFCPIGPWIVTDIDTNNLNLSSSINGVISQNSNTSKRILNDYQVVSMLSKIFTLLPGDIIITGTPANAENSIVKNGDMVELTIENIGTLTNNVKTIY